MNLPAAAVGKTFLSLGGECIRSRALAFAFLAVAVNAVPARAQAGAQLPQATSNEQRTPAGRDVNGERHVTLHAVLAEWRPRGESGPVRKALTFAEEGKAPTTPGPMIRVPAGTRMHVTIRNTLAHPIRVLGLGDRDAAPAPDAPSFLPATVRASQLVIAPGETRDVRFTPSRATTSFYKAFPEGPPASDIEYGVFEGVYIVDPVGSTPPPGERVMMISTGNLDEDSPTFKFFLNGRSWPHTERLSYTVGDTVRWRVINTVPIVHPMHLHGFYFNVDARGDGDVDTVYTTAQRPHVVTDRLNGIGTLRLSWVATEAGNWLFHCHLIRHMGGAQRYAADRTADSATTTVADEHAHAQHDMAGLVMGITVRPRAGVVRTAEPTPQRRIDLWTATRPGVYQEGPGLVFIVQDGAVPAPDSVSALSSTLQLRQGEPTRIMVHNRLSFPLSLHWHGLELKSAYDGVGGWSGEPATPSAPIAPGDSMAVLITPPRAGTFMYHTHGEPGHELAQGLYGGFVVLPQGAPPMPTRDRLFLLASRGAVIDAPPAINGREQAPTEWFTPGESVRLRFGHISADELKEVRLLRDGRVVEWQLLAKDGADLPTAQRMEVSASFELGVGETRDVEWTPTVPGLYVLEVRTTYYPQRGGAQIQRVPFAVGPVTDAAVVAAIRGTALPVVALDAAALAPYGALYTRPASAGSTVAPRLRIMLNREGRLYADRARINDTVSAPQYLVPIGDDTFVFGTFDAGVITEAHADHRVRFLRTKGDITGVEMTEPGAAPIQLDRRDAPLLLDTERQLLIGAWTAPTEGITLNIESASPGLTLRIFGRPPVPLLEDSRTRLVAPAFDLAVALHVVRDGDTVVAIDLLFPGQPAIRTTRVP
ncbi:multicopper oxidase domain-containing protein [Gemmatimonas phototrophica]|uniref:Plastocyanin-like domain-containing protein n=1 Tax=Gemmatimonas phototrophica TaxID=1379270 RepID=A0A143BM74_9BACT|nr:multicopper oxidase domain-containing protein [Gemmatimonas phototrophica]AMW06147.1 hypothetical protein GEMMAAP_17860 [Gemmatimonas phototrophica]